MRTLQQARMFGTEGPTSPQAAYGLGGSLLKFWPENQRVADLLRGTVAAFWVSSRGGDYSTDQAKHYLEWVRNFSTSNPPDPEAQNVRAALSKLGEWYPTLAKVTQGWPPATSVFPGDKSAQVKQNLMKGFAASAKGYGAGAAGKLWKAPKGGTYTGQGSGTEGDLVQGGPTEQEKIAKQAADFFAGLLGGTMPGTSGPSGGSGQEKNPHPGTEYGGSTPEGQGTDGAPPEGTVEETPPDAWKVPKGGVSEHPDPRSGAVKVGPRVSLEGYA